jgi:hypothetical protein
MIDKKPTDFARDDDFPALMAGAHRKPAMEVGSPAVTQHLVFWIPNSVEGRDEWATNIEDFVLSVYDRLAGLDGRDRHIELTSPNLQAKDDRLYLLKNSYHKDATEREREKEKANGKGPTAIPGYPNRYGTVRFAFLWESIRVEVSIESHTEYFTLTTALDLSCCKVPELANTDDVSSETDATRVAEQAKRAANALPRALVDFNTHSSDRFRAIHGKTRPKPFTEKTESELKALHSTIYFTTWEVFFSHFFASSYMKCGKETLGNVCADFRSLVISRSKSPRQFITKPGDALHTSDRIFAPRAFKKEEDIKCVDTILPLFRVGAHEPPERRWPRPMAERLNEYTFSKFYGETAIYGSNLGAQPPEVQADDASPLTYIILATHGDRWQLGRFIDRLNTLGTLRLAGLWDLSRLVMATVSLRVLEAKLDKIAQDLPATIKFAPIDASSMDVDSTGLMKKNKSRRNAMKLEEAKRAAAKRDIAIKDLMERIFKAQKELINLAEGGQPKTDNELQGRTELGVKDESKTDTNFHEHQSDFTDAELHSAAKENRLEKGKPESTSDAPTAKESNPATEFEAAQGPRAGENAGNEKGKIKGGLAYRVERSRYYRQQFRELISADGIFPIGGFLPYHQFVERRLGATYDFINIVGMRYTRLQELITALNRQVSSAEILRLQDQIRAETGTIETLQERAEQAFFLILFPYYTSSFSLHFFSETFLKEHLKVQVSILVGWLSIGAILAFREKLSETRLGGYAIQFVTKSAPAHLRGCLTKLREWKNKVVQTSQEKWQRVQTAVRRIPVRLAKNLATIRASKEKFFGLRFFKIRRCR